MAGARRKRRITEQHKWILGEGVKRNKETRRDCLISING
jgi:hypothetical protein